MKDDYTHITVIMDRTGSMGSVRDDAEGAINFFIDTQKDVEGECSLLFVDFDSTEPFHIVHDGVLASMPKYHLNPRDSTPLHYAVGRGIDETGKRLAALPEDERPGKVIFVIQTDGQENHSHFIPDHPYTLDKVREMIKTQETEFSWEIVFLGMGPDAWGGGQALGISNITVAAGTADSYAGTYSNFSAQTKGFRTGQVTNMAGTRVTVDAQGKVFNDKGEEIDPDTGRVK